MELRSAYRLGKILELLRLHKEHPTAFEASLIDRGLRWRDVASEDFTWADCWAVVEHLPFNDPLVRAVGGANWWWGHPAMDYLVGIYDGLGQIAAVVSRRPGIKKSEIPKPTLRPWDKSRDTEVLKVKPSKLSDLRKLLGWD